MGYLGSPKLIHAARSIAVLSAWAMAGFAAAETPAAAPGQAQSPAYGGTQSERSVSDWLMRMHEASRRRNFIGTFVVSSSNGGMASARIWHACDGDQQIERVESLTGAPRSTFRRNEDVVTFLPESRVVRTERRESLGLFPSLLKAADSSIPEFYSARRAGGDRVAGFVTDVVQLVPKDNLRFGYRIWSEKKSGLVVKLQTLDVDGKRARAGRVLRTRAGRPGAHGQAQPDDGRHRRLAGREA